MCTARIKLHELNWQNYRLMSSKINWPKTREFDFVGVVQA